MFDLNLTPYISIAQGLYFLATGLWPLVSIGTFQKVTGRKTDLWLVKTVGVLVSVIGMALIASSQTRHITTEMLLLAVGSATGLVGIDVIYVAKGRIPPVYLLDAAIELMLIAGWVVALLL